MSVTAGTAATFTAFVLDGPGHRGLQLRAVDPSTAEHFGCAGATHILDTVAGPTFGTVEIVTGRSVRVPGWSPARRGQRARFVPAVVANDSPIFVGWAD